MPDRALSTPLGDSFERTLGQGESRGGDSGNYRRNAALELDVRWVRSVSMRSGTQ